MLRLAVRAHVRHRETKYDEYLVRGDGRDLARAAIAEDVDRVLAAWQRSPAGIRD